ncbi:MAG: MbnP family copper-binding protein [Myxococcota bacterium]
MDASGGSAMLADARMFVSSLEARNSDGDWIPVSLTQESIWQHESVALLDFEDGTGSCSTSGTTETNSEVVGTLPDEEFDTLRFAVGLPFELNHLDDATAPAPLNSPGMFWAWQDGYKFLRVDWMPTGANRWNVHLGSRACDNGGAPNTAPPTSCDRPNRPEILIEGWSIGESVTIDLGQLVADSNLSANLENSPPGCMSAPAETADCDPVFSSLGLDFASGGCESGCDGQSVFSR